MVSEPLGTYPWVRTNRSRTDRFIAWLKPFCRRSALLYAGLYLLLVAVTERA
jgi:hypothetical protein